MQFEEFLSERGPGNPVLQPTVDFPSQPVAGGLVLDQFRHQGFPCQDVGQCKEPGFDYAQLLIEERHHGIRDDQNEFGRKDKRD